MILRQSTKNICILIVGGAGVLYCCLIAFLYNVVFSHHEKTTLGNPLHNRSKVALEPNRNAFNENLPKHVQRVPITQFIGSLPLHQMSEIQAAQCGGTRGNKAVPRRNKQNNINDPWPNFSPSSFQIETDFRVWKSKNNSEYWKRVSIGLDGEELNVEKLKMNELHFTLNGHLKPKNGHLPIWLRTFKRTSPLDIALAAICRVDDIADTILYVTIDGGDFDGVVEELLKVACVRIKIYFHPYLSDLRNLGLKQRDRNTALILNSHYVYGMYLLTHKLLYPYVITLEDDLEASVDFYKYHYSLYHMVYGKHATYYDSKKIFAISAYSHGPVVDCHFIVPKLSNDNSSRCGMDDVHQLVEEDYFPGWGSGLTKEAFLEYWSDWKSNHVIYDYALTQLRAGGGRCSLIPCSPRVRTIANTGVNGRNNGRWDHYLSTFAQWGQKALERVYYVDRRDGVVKDDEKNKFMYNKIVQ